MVEEKSLFFQRKKTKYWSRNGGFAFSPEVRVYLLIDSPMARMQPTETIFAGIITCMDIMSSSALLSSLPSIFDIRCNYINL